jgi:hypothetical protein
VEFAASCGVGNPGFLRISGKELLLLAAKNSFKSHNNNRHGSSLLRGVNSALCIITQVMGALQPW